mmetsp:Transcript_34917/g.85415  ORF Transcript_34917/g.85415 Transcript_34917/m.85415 type:complete len:257 (+) Transcript_34917:101-871(+)
MSSAGSGYDLSASTYSREGRVFQVEYAQKAVEKGGTCVGVVCKDGVVLGVEKVVTSRLLVPGSARLVNAVDTHAGVATAGLVPDARQLVARARADARQHKNSYNEPVPLAMLNAQLSGYVHSYTLYGYMRPFGCAVLLGGYDEHRGPALFAIEPSGVSFGYHATAVGKAAQTAKSELEKLDLKNMTAAAAVKEVARIIYHVHDDVKDKLFELELSWCCDASERKFVRVPKALFDEAEAAAKAALSDGDDDEDLDDD